MGGFFGMAADRDCMVDVFFGTDYHSHLGTRIAGIAAYNPDDGIQRDIHNIENSPFRTKFAGVCDDMKGCSAIGVISDYDPQPLLISSELGMFAIAVIGAVNNAEELIRKYMSSGGHFNVMSGGRVNCTELIAVLINKKNSFPEGIRFAQDVIDGSASIIILKDDGHIIVARDGKGRLPVLIGRGQDCFCAAFESFSYKKLGCTDYAELGPGEIAEISSKEVKTLLPAKEEMRICSFLWSYYGYPTSTYEGVNVEVMRCRNGGIMAENDRKSRTIPEVDYVCGVPDSGTPHAIGYANESHIPFERPYIKYTPTWSRSFIPPKQSDRDRIARMKQIPVTELIDGKSLLFVDDSIVRGTQLKETVDFLSQNGAKAVHMRSACPPIMYSCKYLNFSRATSDRDLLARRVIVELEGEEGLNHLDEYSDAETERGRKLRETICEKFHFDSLEFQTLEGVVKAIGIDPCRLCTYCWDGKE
ncbi:MAG: amidophosphoribosyltransferase [Clostridia bacterium]|nr:amidophosphoribosyltransferase [Clostridia bacterium]